MIQKCKYLISCDNDCGSFPVAVKSKKDIKDCGFVVYRYKHVSPISDELFLSNNPDAFVELQFCCQECADEYFEYYKDYVGHYKKCR